MLLVPGRNDRLFPGEHTDAIVAILPQAKVGEFEAGAHFIPISSRLNSARRC